VLQRKLGRSGLSVSAIGFGAWGIGGATPGATSYSRTDDATSLRALETAFERGITFYDTSSAYGGGHSEELIGRAFRDRRDKAVIATKAGMLPGFAGTDFSPAWLRRSLEQSLLRLGTDRVDVLQLHNPPPEAVKGKPEILETLRRFQEEGKIRAFGISTKSPADALAMLDAPGLACLQVNLNLLDWRAADTGLLERAAARGVGIIARTPLAFGFLSGAVDATTRFAADDHRSKLGPEQARRWARAADDIFAAIAEAGPPRPRALTALRFCLSFPAVATAIPGVLTPQEAALNAEAAALPPFTEEEMRLAELAYRRHEKTLGG
jgi:aryl-alcohol dehydrogenase-like predicted oxidoreductase